MHFTEVKNFPAIVRRLETLGYLPITHGFYIDKNQKIVQHDTFYFTVPKSLQKTVDRFPWDTANPFIRGAIIQFERNNGILGPRGVSEGRLHKNVVQALLSPDAKPCPWRWRWALVNKANGTRIPEQLHIWAQGKGWVWHTLVNTGVLGSTPNGTWPIYQRLPRTTMRGTFPIPISWGQYRSLAGQTVPTWAGSPYRQSARGIVNGHPVTWQPYDDPGILWVNYFDAGRGIHYYPRAAYGFPQSAGCVEEPYANAPITYRWLHYGVPVSISPHQFSGKTSKAKQKLHDQLKTSDLRETES